MPQWWNWQTHRTQNPASRGVRVQVPPMAIFFCLIQTNQLQQTCGPCCIIIHFPVKAKAYILLCYHIFGGFPFPFVGMPPKYKRGCPSVMQPPVQMSHTSDSAGREVIQSMAPWTTRWPACLCDEGTEEASPTSSISATPDQSSPALPQAVTQEQLIALQQDVNKMGQMMFQSIMRSTILFYDSEIWSCFII